MLILCSLQAFAQPLLKSTPLSAELRTTIPVATPAVALPTTKLLPLTYETNPIAYRFAAPAPAFLTGKCKSNILLHLSSILDENR